MDTTPASITVARYLVSRIEELGVKVVPVLQGGVIMKMIDEVGESDILRYIVPNHEQALAMMVDAYARLNGYGVGFATSGPGAVNLATGIACSYYDSIPCLFITGQVGMFHVKGERGVRQRGFQETDVVSMLAPITKYSVLLEKADDARYVFEKAVHLSKSGRPGPVVIDLPYNVQRALVVPEQLRGYTPPVDEMQGGNAASDANLILEKIRKAKRPLLLIGGGVRIAGNADEAYTFVEKSGLPVATTWTSADMFPQEFPLYLGNVGRSGDAAAIDAVQACDLLISLGSRFAPKAIISETRFAAKAEVIAVDIDRSEIEEGIIDPKVKIVADLRAILPELIGQLGNTPLIGDEWRNEVLDRKASMKFVPELSDDGQKYVNPYKFAEQLFQSVESDGVMVADTGANLTWVMQGYKLKRGQRLISAWGNSPMGYAFPAAIGAWLAQPDRQVVCTIGDGGFQMNIQELQTMIGNKVDIKVFILNNRCYGNIKMGARREFNARIHGNDADTGYTAPDFVKVAQAYGLKTETLANDAEVTAKLARILAHKGAMIVDVNIDPAQEHVELKI